MFAAGMPLSRTLKIDFRTGCVLIAIALLSACTAPQPGAEFNDPYEASNRAFYDISVTLDRIILRPAGQVAAALPMEVTGPVSNFADNVGLPGMVANGRSCGTINSSASAGWITTLDPDTCGTVAKFFLEEVCSSQTYF